MKQKPPQRGEVNIVRLVIYLPEDLHRAVRHRALDEGVSATKLTEKLLRDYLKTPVKKGGK